MTLYEIDSGIMDILALLEPDPETGLMPDNWEELTEKLDELGMQRQQKLENVARYVLNIRADISSLKAEEGRLEKRRKVLENKQDSLMRYLDVACAGKKTNLGIATLSYRKSEKVEVLNEREAILFLEKEHHSCLKFAEPEISKSEVKTLIKSGVEVPGVAIVAGQSCSLK